MNGLREILPAESRGDLSEVTLGDTVSVEALVRPGSDAEVADVVRWSGNEGVTVLPIGTGRHLPRVVAAERAAVVLTERLAGIRIYEPADLTLTAGAGTLLTELRAALAPHDQWLPFDPPDVDARTLGGLVASGLSGPLAAGYGALRNHVLGATVVLGDGRTIRLGGRVVKNVAGFDLLRPMIGSLGGLAVLTEICVRLFPLPHTQQVLVIRGNTPAALVGAARAVARAPVMPASAVLLRGSPELGAQAALLVRMHGASSAVEADQRAFRAVMEGSVEVLEGDDAAAILRVARDHPDGAPSWRGRQGDRDVHNQDSALEAPEMGVGVASSLPARLGDVLAAMESTLGPRPFCSDVMSGNTRFAFAAEQASALVGLRRALEALGGSLGIERLPAGVDDVGGAVSTVSVGEAALSERVRSVFDAPGVFWRARQARQVDRSTGSGGGSA